MYVYANECLHWELKRYGIFVHMLILFQILLRRINMWDVHNVYVAAVTSFVLYPLSTFLFPFLQSHSCFIHTHTPKLCACVCVVSVGVAMPTESRDNLLPCVAVLIKSLSFSLSITDIYRIH